ncbi:MAG TPA: xylulokinase [Candidatus Bathyarchaeia archaeon]
MDLYVGVDSGTQSTKALVMDACGTVLVKASRPHTLLGGLPPGHMEQRPEDWWLATVESIRECLADPKVDASKVKAIGVSGQQHGFVPLDADGRVIRPAKLWNDTSTAAEAQALIDGLGGLKRVIGLVGNGVPPGFTAPKILWLKTHEPENYRRLSTVLLPHDYLNFRLTGARTMEYGDASGTALMDVRSRRWSREAVEAIDLGLMEKLPRLQPSNKPAGRLSAAASEELGLSRSVLVSAGGGDNMMGAIGTGNTRPGVITVSLGTSGTVYAFSEKPIVDPRGEVATFCDSTNHWLPLVCTMNVTVATDLARNAFSLSYEGLEEAVEGVPAGSDGLLFLPYLTGERTPNIPGGRGVLYGLTPSNYEPRHMARATVEGVTLGLNYGLNRLRELGISPTEVRLTGGGARNRAWRRVAADIFDADAVTLHEEEGAAYGAAIQAMWCHRRAQGESVAVSEITDELIKLNEGSRVSPNPMNAAKYRKVQGRHDSLMKALRGFFDAL